ncbi:MAG: hypothetical protein ABIH72_04370 [archaeon]
MIKGLMLQWAGTGTYNDLVIKLDEIGFFTLVLPFLLIFALVFGILSKLEMFKDAKGVNAVIALSIALLSLWSGYVSNFFAILFPRFGMGIAILLVALLMMGIFVPFKGNEKWGNYIFLGIGAFIFLIITFVSLDEYSYFSGGWFQNYWSSLFVAVLIIAAIVVIITTSNR